MMVIAAYIVLTFTAIQLLVSLANLIAETSLPDTRKTHSSLVSVLIPARNEAHNIGNLLDDLIHQDYKDIEIVVYNDQSEDETANIVDEYARRDSRIRLIGSGILPDGWLGKNFACHSLAAEAKGSYMLFLDADVRVGGNLIGRSISFSENYDLGLISIFPKQIIKSIGEWITVPNMNYILLSLLPLVLVRKSGYPSLSAANGQFMFFRKQEYLALRPHEAVKADKVEDISIARLFKKRGIKIACLAGDDTITCRMYKGFREAVNGFSKNVIAFFGNSFFLGILFWLITTFGFIPVIVSLTTPMMITYLAGYMATRILISAASKQKIIYSLVLVIPLQISLALFIYRAFINRISGKYQWKGRNIE